MNKNLKLLALAGTLLFQAHTTVAQSLDEQSNLDALKDAQDNQCSPSSAYTRRPAPSAPADDSVAEGVTTESLPPSTTQSPQASQHASSYDFEPPRPIARPQQDAINNQNELSSKALGLTIRDLIGGESAGGLCGGDVFVKDANGPALLAGIRIGDLITYERFEGSGWVGVERFNKLLAQADPTKEVRIEVCGHNMILPYNTVFVDPPGAPTRTGDKLAKQAAGAARVQEVRKNIIAAQEFYKPRSLPKTAPFSYYEGNMGMTLLYKDRCPIANSKDWLHSEQILNNGVVMMSCWAKDKSKNSNEEFITNCALVNNASGKPVIGNLGGCMLVSASFFIKGNPIRPRAF